MRPLRVKWRAFSLEIPGEILLFVAAKALLLLSLLS